MGYPGVQERETECLDRDIAIEQLVGVARFLSQAGAGIQGGLASQVSMRRSGIVAGKPAPIRRYGAAWPVKELLRILGISGACADISEACSVGHRDFDGSMRKRPRSGRRRLIACAFPHATDSATVLRCNPVCRSAPLQAT